MTNLRLGKLNKEKFYDGADFFQCRMPCRRFCCSFLGDPCCVPKWKVVAMHNDFTDMISEKIYRFKEHFMWFLDTGRLVHEYKFFSLEQYYNESLLAVIEIQSHFYLEKDFP